MKTREKIKIPHGFEIILHIHIDTYYQVYAIINYNIKDMLKIILALTVRTITIDYLIQFFKNIIIKSYKFNIPGVYN